MSLLAALTTDNNIADEKDSVGGSRVRDSGLYPMKVALAYVSKASSGALALNVTFKDDEGEVRQQFWMTSGTAKGCKNYYEDKQGQKHYLPGFVHANALTLLTVGKEIGQLDTEKKVVNLYSSTEKKEVPTQVDMLMDLIGQEVLVGLLKQTVDKTAKDAAGVYQPTGESREENEVDKIFRARDKMTTAEIRAQAEQANFFAVWEQKWAGKVKDKTTKGANTGTAGAPRQAAAAGGNSRPTTSLFGAQA